MEVVDIFATFFHIYRIPKLLNSIDEFQLVFCFDIPSTHAKNFQWGLQSGDSGGECPT